MTVSTHDIPIDSTASVMDCMESFRTFCRHVQVQSDDGRYRTWQPYPGQRRMIDHLIQGDWLWVLKARRTGITTVAVAFGAWIVATGADRTVAITAMTDTKAMGIMRMMREMLARLPYHLRPRVVRQSDHYMETGTGCRVVVEVGSANAGRSERIDYAIVDEACYVGRLVEVLKGLEPAVDRAGGVVVVVSTVNSPDTPGVAVSFDEFRGGWNAALANTSAYKPLFVSCFELPGQDQEWYFKTAAEHVHQPGFMAKEHPRNATECWETIGGRVYPTLTRETHFKHRDIPIGTPLARAIDFGAHKRSAFACVWAAHFPDEPSGFSIEPECEECHYSPSARGRYPEGSEQMFAYVRNANTGKPMDEHNDVPDALRYLVTDQRWAGHVHVYRILTVRNDDDFFWDAARMFHRVCEMSGMVCFDPSRNLWRRGPMCEDYVDTICDSASPGFISLLAEQRGPTSFPMGARAYIPPPEFTGKSVEDGITWVNALINGVAPIRVERHLFEHEQQVHRLSMGGQPMDRREVVIQRRIRFADRKKRQFIYGHR